MFVVNVEGAIYRDGKWLMIKRSEKEEHAAGCLSMVGGKCDLEGVSTDILERTLKREIFEEVGIEVEDLTYVNSSSFVTDKGTHVIDIVFLCQHITGEPYAKSMEEVGEVMWMTMEDIMVHEDAPSYLKENITVAANKLILTR
ncbi:NUDIX hydrolase [Terribacillus saccharophilus]|uniref:DNA mismatch repair protein MutT n=1 Tax=Terribacillus saccharophilus TaxID=361277 RepID=A0A075LP02_9BACI|nr:MULTISPECIES: NUDIX domain-containing protein [Terribacillus]AIF66138.1 DNA mismatch repair protein MutT [Terribacillus goriensis]MEC0281300.1 NUDIX domain-containing protein [Terribacillus saccharophilus]MEC0289500.1 NUDIX domain-containing protein [Terribacillus saccharophilus]